MRKTINVTQKDIDNSKPMRGSDSCPVARAVCRALKKKLGYVNVYGEGYGKAYFGYIVFGKSQIRKPSEVIDFVKNFDERLPVKPFTFTMEY